MAAHYIPITKKSLWNNFFCIFDLEDQSFQEMAYEKDIKVKIYKTFVHPEESYAIYFVKVPKKQTEVFVDILEELEKKMLLLGHTDYPEFCEEFERKMDVM